jgi:hypothetical protein
MGFKSRCRQAREFALPALEQAARFAVCGLVVIHEGGELREPLSQ